MILLTRFCKLLTTVAILSGGHVPQVPEWHDASDLVTCSWHEDTLSFTKLTSIHHDILFNKAWLIVMCRCVCLQQHTFSHNHSSRIRFFQNSKKRVFTFFFWNDMLKNIENVIKSIKSLERASLYTVRSETNTHTSCLRKKEHFLFLLELCQISTNFNKFW